MITRARRTRRKCGCCWGSWGSNTLIDGELALAESYAILRYLAARERRADLLPAAPRERAPVDWLLDAVATTLRPAGREVDAPAYGWRPGRGIGAEPPQREELPAAIASIAPRLEAFARLEEWVETVGGHPAWAPVAAESGVPL